MRVLHITDTHLGVERWVHRPGDAAPRPDVLAPDADRALRAALAPALHGEVDLVIHTGDVFDRSRPPARTVAYAAELLALVARQVPVVVMAGNHDRRGLLRYLPPRASQLHVVDRPTRLVMGDLALAVVPFEPTAAAFAVAARLAVGSGADLLLAHQAFDGHEVPTHFRGETDGTVVATRWYAFRADDPRRTDTIGAEHLPVGVRFVACGHLHPRQVVEVGEATVVCPGSTMRTSFAERASVKQVATWSFERSVEWSFRALPVRRWWSADDFVDPKQVLDHVAAGDLVRVSRCDVRPADVWALGAWVAAEAPASVRTEASRSEVASGPPAATQLSLLR